MAILPIAAAIAALATAQQPATTATWELLDLPAAAGSLAPRIGVLDDRVLVSWLEPAEGEGRFALRAADLAGGVARPLAAPAVVADDLFVNWADTPGVVPAPGGALVAHWLQELGGDNYAYGVQLARSTDGGESWEPLGSLHADQQAVEHGFASFAPGPSGLTAVWLDGHGTAAEVGDGVAKGADEHGHDGRGAMTLHTAHVSDGVRQELELDADVCDCCPTSIVATPAGPVVAYRDRVPGEELRDIAVVRWLGDRWSDPALVHADGWVVAGCPVNGPVLAARGQQVALAWFTAADRPAIKVALSADGGQSFGPPREAFVSSPGSLALGRVALEFDAGGALHLVHLVQSGGSAELIHQAREPGGRWSEPQAILESSPTRRSGVPVLRRTGDRLLLATTSVGSEGRTQVQLRSLRAD
ncbi:hypothetical protein [Engelhardtia mirabilis]|uniref:BNR/Asp-box repeat protein n=1 Tax=Engelhardtia mirabilis TaxID=2528011 RepID=A0A518BS76_9BACT|nr:hypothetical protein Pla133_49430 [Planctomycetes bacterium Pla133]QDV04147.1 hypothetical protein Pla86_49410 [Planctomycetes bacterium Pla86]